jgi:hypothetical protein
MRTVVDWLPRNHEALFHQGTQTITYLNAAANRDRMGFNPGTMQGKWIATEFQVRLAAFSAALTDWENPAQRTPAKTAELQITEKAFREAYRQLYTGFLKSSPLVTDKDLLEMGLPERHSGGGKPAPLPTTLVEASVVPIGPGIIEIHFRDKGSDSKAKPAGVHGAEIAWAILDTPPADWSELVHSSFDTHTPLRMTFENHLRGKTLYFALRWENTTGEKGDWNEIQSVIIP